MTTVTYTKTLDVDSEAVDSAVYDERTRELTLDLNDRIYRYSNVPLLEALRFENSNVSVGRDVLPAFKRTFGPGEFVGYYDEVVFKDANVKPATVGSAQDFTPKALTDTTASNSDAVRLSLTSSTPEKAAERRVSVVFANSLGDVKTYNTKATDAETAKVQVEEIAEALGVNLTVKEVTVYFE